MNTLQPPEKETILIRKASGEEEPFDARKLADSLKNAGADTITANEIVAAIEAWLFEGITTRKIYGRAHALLRKKRSKAASRYKLKEAILQLGPTGYPFEWFMGQVYARRGYKTQVGIVVPGTCVTHEMDVIATNAHKQYLLECKYSSDQGKTVSVQVPLYVRARVDDIIKQRKDLPEYKKVDFIAGVITNTRFSDDAAKFGKCANMHMLAWDYPRGNGLKEIIEREKLFPVTILGGLNKREKEALLKEGIVTCEQLSQAPEAIDKLQLSKRKYNSLMRELGQLNV
ncbi:MAG: hypothetical protein R6U66_00405 [Bacteroidales bacterium]